MGLLKLTRLPKLACKALNFKDFLVRIHFVLVRFISHSVFLKCQGMNQAKIVNHLSLKMKE